MVRAIPQLVSAPSNLYQLSTILGGATDDVSTVTDKKYKQGKQRKINKCKQSAHAISINKHAHPIAKLVRALVSNRTEAMRVVSRNGIEIQRQYTIKRKGLTKYVDNVYTLIRNTVVGRFACLSDPGSYISWDGSP